VSGAMRWLPSLDLLLLWGHRDDISVALRVVTDDDSWLVQRKLLGAFLKSQRQLAKLSLRDLAERTSRSGC
jgi:hypothetical protein